MLGTVRDLRFGLVISVSAFSLQAFAVCDGERAALSSAISRKNNLIAERDVLQVEVSTLGGVVKQQIDYIQSLNRKLDWSIQAMVGVANERRSFESGANISALRELLFKAKKQAELTSAQFEGLIAATRALLVAEDEKTKARISQLEADLLNQLEESKRSQIQFQIIQAKAWLIFKNDQAVIEASADRDPFNILLSGDLTILNLKLDTIQLEAIKKLAIELGNLKSSAKAALELYLDHSRTVAEIDKKIANLQSNENAKRSEAAAITKERDRQMNEWNAKSEKLGVVATRVARIGDTHLPNADAMVSQNANALRSCEARAYPKDPPGRGGG